MQPKPLLFPSSHSLWPYGATTPLKTIGAFRGTASVTPDSAPSTWDFHVVSLPRRSCCLLSRKTSVALGLIKLDVPKQINQVATSPDVPALLQEFDDICHGIGCHRDQIVSLPMDESVTPVASPPSRVPIHLLPAVKAELDRLQSEDTIEDVPVDDNNQWISRMVPVPRKIEGSETSGIRITIDLRNVNKGLKKVHHHMPTVEQLRYDLNGAKVFSHLDLKDAFSQLPLDEASKKICTFSTPWGLKRLKRLVQGATPSSALFHETLRRDLEGINNVLNIADNVVIWGCGTTIEQAKIHHYETLKQVLGLFRRKGLTINKPKCIIDVPSISFFGYIFSADGVSPDPAKITALRGATPPSSKEDICSFLGMAGFNQQFIPDYATISEPLRRLTTKTATFTWGPEQENAFQLIKRSLEQTALLSFFDPKKHSTLFTDASPVGVNATLAQDEGNGTFRPISFASRALSPTEQKYSQIEREAAAMHFGCHRFELFLRGAPFTHYIDLKPVKPMMDNPRKDAPARIERVRMKLQGFQSTIKLIDGKKNPADYLSRHPLPLTTCSIAEFKEYADVENHVFLITQMLPPAITLDRIKQEIPKDPQLSAVKRLLDSDQDPSTLTAQSKQDLKPFITIWDQLSSGKGVVLRGEKVVLPKTLTDDAVKISHAGHMGIQKLKQYLRSSIWFPHMDYLIEQRVKQCIPCQAATPLHVKQPLQMSDLPPEPWQTIAADLFGPLPTGEKILVLKCLRSKWPEIKVFLKNQTTNVEKVIQDMEKIFLTHGIPDEILTDNGPPFNSKAFTSFSTQAGFHHGKITPMWPQANGQAESFMKSLGKIIRVGVTQKQNWQQQLDEFLMSYRATPHPATNCPPATLMFPNRRYKTRLPSYAGKVSPKEIEAAFKANTARSKAYTDNRRNAKEVTLPR